MKLVVIAVLILIGSLPGTHARQDTPTPCAGCHFDAWVAAQPTGVGRALSTLIISNTPGLCVLDEFSDCVNHNPCSGIVKVTATVPTGENVADSQGNCSNGPNPFIRNYTFESLNCIDNSYGRIEFRWYTGTCNDETPQVDFGVVNAHCTACY